MRQSRSFDERLNLGGKSARHSQNFKSLILFHFRRQQHTGSRVTCHLARSIFRERIGPVANDAREIPAALICTVRTFGSLSASAGPQRESMARII
jgi:hypothetical protein